MPGTVLQFSGLVDDLKNAGNLPVTSQVHEVMACVYGRLNTHLFENRPKVSNSFYCLREKS